MASLSPAAIRLISLTSDNVSPAKAPAADRLNTFTSIRWSKLRAPFGHTLTRTSALMVINTLIELISRTRNPRGSLAGFSAQGCAQRAHRGDNPNFHSWGCRGPSARKLYTLFSSEVRCIWATGNPISTVGGVAALSARVLGAR